MANLPRVSYEEFTSQYTKYLHEITQRLWEVVSITQKLEAGQATNGNGAIDLDLAYLQIRKVLELLMFLILAAHRLDNSNIDARLARAYSALDIEKGLRKLNHKYFPVSITLVDDGNGETMIDYPESTRLGPCFRPEELREVYGRLCGDRAHALGDYIVDDWTRIKQEAFQLRLISHRIGSLLLFHQIVVSDDYSIMAKIHDSETGAPKVWVLRLNHEQTRINRERLAKGLN